MSLLEELFKKKTKIYFITAIDKSVEQLAAIAEDLNMNNDFSKIDVAFIIVNKEIEVCPLEKLPDLVKRLKKEGVKFNLPKPLDYAR